MLFSLAPDKDFKGIFALTLQAQLNLVGAESAVLADDLSAPIEAGLGGGAGKVAVDDAIGSSGRRHLGQCLCILPEKSLVGLRRIESTDEFPKNSRPAFGISY